MIKRKSRNVRRIVDGRLVYFSQATDEAFWHGQWRDRLTRRHYAAALAGQLEYLEHVFVRWLPKDGLILEAGCGRGQIVVALRQRGWQIEGVDYSAETVEALRSLFPDLPVRTADVTRLDVPDASYAGYISIGVVEHRREGPEPFLREAYRVLRAGGIAVITVPYLNPLRRWKARLGCYRGSEPALPFYQYAFSAAEFCGFLRDAGFQIVDQQPYGGYKGLIDELPPARLLLGPLKKLPGIGPPLRRWLAHNRLGHMLAVVCRKPQ
jgi:SAM-dependent methyltransferase